MAKQFVLAGLAALATSVTATCTSYNATFEESNITLSSYDGANFHDFNIQYVTPIETKGTTDIRPASGIAYATSSLPEGVGEQSGNGTLVLNASGNSGHLYSFYFACFSTESFGQLSTACNFSMNAHCMDGSGSPVTLSYSTAHKATNGSMEFLDLTEWYQAYAAEGKLAGDGSDAQCTSYEMMSVPSMENGLPVAFAVDNVMYSVES